MFFIIIILLSVMGLVGTDIFSPSLPAIAQAYHQPAQHAQLTITLFLAGFAVSQLFYGPISDRIGRKPPVLAGVGIFIVGSVLCLISSSFFTLCLGRVIQGIGVGGGLSLARIILRDCYHGKSLSVRSSQVAMFVSLSPAVAPFLGGLLQQYGDFRASFMFMLIYSLVLLVLLLLDFKEPIQEKDPNLTLRTALTHYGNIIKNVTFMRYVIIAGFAFSVIILCANIMPFITQTELKLSPVQNGNILLFAALGISVGSLISSRIVKRYSSHQLIVVGLGVLLTSGILLVLTQLFFGTHLIWLMPLIFLATISCGFIFPNGLAVAFSQVHAKIGVAGAIYGSIQISISMLVNFLLNSLPFQGQEVLGGFYAVLGALGLTILFLRTPPLPE